MYSRPVYENLNLLAPHGVNDQHFGMIHHWGPKTKGIESFKRYCLKTPIFPDNGPNARVARRLQYVVDAIKAGTSKSLTTLFTEAAKID
jgi:hypothetical protein